MGQSDAEDGGGRKREVSRGGWESGEMKETAHDRLPLIASRVVFAVGNTINPV